MLLNDSSSTGTRRIRRTAAAATDRKRGDGAAQEGSDERRKIKSYRLRPESRCEGRGTGQGLTRVVHVVRGGAEGARRRRRRNCAVRNDAGKPKGQKKDPENETAARVLLA